MMVTGTSNGAEFLIKEPLPNGTAVVVVTIGQRRPVGRMRVWHVHCE